MPQGASLVSLQNRVESPFIIVKIGKYTFGHCDKPKKEQFNRYFNVTYPNYMDSLNVTKVNGAVNTYSINMIYAVTEYDDPNMLDKVFSSVSKSREIVLSYGDWNMPGFIYKEERALITKLQTKVNMQTSTITYTITCTSVSMASRGICDDFPAKVAKPSDEIIRLLLNERYGLQDVFTGMRNLTHAQLNYFFARNDREVQLEAKTCDVLEYISYLVSCMVSVEDDPNSTLKHFCYFWSVYDDVKNEFGGSYFKTQCVAATTANVKTFNTYEVDVGYPSAEFVTDFSVNNDDSWSLLYEYSQSVKVPSHSYYIDAHGEVLKENSTPLVRSPKYLTTTEANRNWWSLVTQFPITATLTIKGLLRPALLMTYVKVNVYFHGKKHVTSGLYIITKQQDTINNTGYRTTLSLTRISGDEDYA